MGGMIMRKSKFNKPLTVALTNDAYENIKENSDREQISMAEFVRYIIDSFYVNNTSLKKASDEFAKSLSLIN